ncbi:MAG TPA: LamG-like jellyroll fold domain-containing protein [Steroidobacteraceae bacterium]|nr:LamG-like jellyroll fold domain-containing protein [Steroidobacteraceae bacterium]
MRYDQAGASGGGSNLMKVACDNTGKTNQGYESANNTQTTAFQSMILAWEAGDRERLYINGVEDTPTYAPATGSGVTVNANSFWMHRGGKDATNAWDGVVYEIRVYSRKLTAAEILTIHTMRGLDSIKNGLIHHWHGDEGAPGTNVSTILDRSGNGHTGTAGGTNTPTFAADLVHFRRRRAA